MSTKQTRPNSRIPIAGGSAPSVEYLRWFADLDRRMGGVEALSNVELDAKAEEIRALWQAYEDNGAPFKVQDEGALVGIVRAINFVGFNVAASLESGAAKVEISPTGAIKGQAVVTVPPMSMEFSGSVSIPGVTADMVAMFTLGAHLNSDENTEEMLSVISQRATCATDSVSVYMAFGEPTGGPVRINYVVS